MNVKKEVEMVDKIQDERFWRREAKKHIKKQKKLKFLKVYNPAVNNGAEHDVLYAEPVKEYPHFWMLEFERKGFKIPRCLTFFQICMGVNGELIEVGGNLR